MGEIAEDMIDGDGATCSGCGIYFEDEHGYPVLCLVCWASEEESGRVLRHETRTKTFDHRTDKLIEDHTDTHFMTESGLQKAHLPEL